jgi:hypothetical protein
MSKIKKISFILTEERKKEINNWIQRLHELQSMTEDDIVYEAILEFFYKITDYQGLDWVKIEDIEDDNNISSTHISNEYILNLIKEERDDSRKCNSCGGSDTRFRVEENTKYQHIKKTNQIIKSETFWILYMECDNCGSNITVIDKDDNNE